MNDIIDENGFLNLDIEKDYYELDMQQRLDTVTQHPSKKDLFICPISIENEIGLFLNAYKIPYKYIKDLTKIDPIEIKRQMNRYLKIRSFNKKPVVFITPFDNNALFTWTLQLFGNTKDPAYVKYLDYVDKIIDTYYEQHYKPSYE